MIAQLLKALIPVSVRRRWISPAREQIQTSQLHSDWLNVRASLGASARVQGSASVIIVPTDAYTLVGSLGDDAMITASMAMARLWNPTAELYILTASEAADQTAERIGLKPIRIWQASNFSTASVEILRERNPAAVLALGADVIDGHYGSLSAAKILVFSDIAARLGIPTTVLGFSFNSRPLPVLRNFFDNLHEAVRLNVRDEDSLSRFRKFTTAKGRLAADAAFSLPPNNGEELNAAHNWVQSRRDAGDLVVAFNVHPMLFSDADPAKIRALILASAETLRRVSASRKVSWILTPHDHREEVGDPVCLRPIYDMLSPEFGDRLFYFDGRHRAATLKGLASLLDGAVTGRMHFAIATLGSQVPIMALSYQDKFEGLLRHFGLPESLLISPSDVIRGGSFNLAIEAFVDDIAGLKDRVVAEHPKVMEASALNFDVLVLRSA